MYKYSTSEVAKELLQMSASRSSSGGASGAIISFDDPPMTLGSAGYGDSGNPEKAASASVEVFQEQLFWLKLPPGEVVIAVERDTTPFSKYILDTI